MYSNLTTDDCELTTVIYHTVLSRQVSVLSYVTSSGPEPRGAGTSPDSRRVLGPDDRTNEETPT